MRYLVLCALLLAIVPLMALEINDYSAGETYLKNYVLEYLNTSRVERLPPSQTPPVVDPPEITYWEHPPLPLDPISPVYPDSARQAGIQGIVILEAEILMDGSVREVFVRRSLQRGKGGLDQAAVDAVKAVRWQPGRNANDEPINTLFIVPVRFRLD